MRDLSGFWEDVKDFSLIISFVGGFGIYILCALRWAVTF